MPFVAITLARSTPAISTLIIFAAAVREISPLAKLSSLAGRPRFMEAISARDQAALVVIKVTTVLIAVDDVLQSVSASL